MILFKEEWAAIKAILNIITAFPRAILIVIIFGILASLSEGLGISLFIPLFQVLVRNDVNLGDNILSQVWFYVFSGLSPSQVKWLAPVLILGSIFLKNIILYINTALTAQYNWRIIHRLRTNIYHQLLEVEYQFLWSRDTGSIISILDKESWQTARAISTFTEALINLCTIIILSIFLLLTSWQLTILAILILFIISNIIRMLVRRVKKLGQNAARANAVFVERVLEGMTGMQTIRLFGMQAYERQSFERASNQVSSAFTYLDMLMGAVSPLSEILFSVLIAIFVIIVLKLGFSIPTMLTFTFILYRLQPRLKNFDAARVSLVALNASIQSVMNLLHTTEQLRERSGTYCFTGLNTSIQFKSVGFRYQTSEELALQHISFDILPNKTTAIVGRSGAGKSTIIRLLTRLIDPTEGTIEVNGRLLQSLNLASWRDRIAVVSQDIHLFNTSVYDNIAYGNPKIADVDVFKAAQQANADWFIAQLPHGYDTIVGNRGVRLSGGQRQRIALARALIRNAEILILDEATNSLDSLSENLIQETLNALAAERTVIIIAHRLSTIEKADCIVVLERGRVVERGTLDDLVNQNGIFARLYRLQVSVTRDDSSRNV